ncbi:MAG TPA: 50S ribosomal protein L24 [Roseiflexaceae bacterium]|nr:50S ribosomal protein L24 [Roseiflexaceae bacterium]HMP39883.1 50S ribosomal protein L24 [Roseiflexaceae bacterium]
MHVKTGDEVLIIAGKDRGQYGKIKAVLPNDNRVVVEGLNIVKRHTKPRGPTKPGGIIELEAPLDASNVMLICPSCEHAVRTGKRFLEETDHKGRPRKVRFCKRCDATIDQT